MLRPETDPKTAADYAPNKYPSNFRQPLEKQERRREQHWVARAFKSRIDEADVQDWYGGCDSQKKQIQQCDSDNACPGLPPS